NSTSSATGTDESDYVTQNGTLVFGVGETNKSIIIPILDDYLVELEEAITISLSNPKGSVLGTQNTATLTIYDNERPGSLDFEFNPNVSGWVDSLALQADGKVLVGGRIFSANREIAIARLNGDSTLDSSFSPPAGPYPGF